MRLYTPADVPSVTQGRVCRQSRLVSIVGAAAMLAMMFGVPSFLLWQAQPPMWVVVLILLFDGLILTWLGGIAIKSLRNTNWLLQIAPDGVWINLRSYQNRDFAPAATVLFVPYAEIASVSPLVVKRSERNGDRTVVWTDRYLDVQLVDPAAAEVAAEIAEERRRTLPGVHLGGLVTSNSRSNHVPVTLPSDQVLRLAWRGRYDFVVPSLKKVLRELAVHCTITESTVHDVTDVNTLSDQELDRLILDSVETGDTLGAVKLLRDKRGYSLKDAKEFVDELTVRQ